MAELHNTKDFKTGLLLRQCLSFKAYVRIPSPYSRILFQNCTKTKIYKVHLILRLWLMLQTSYCKQHLQHAKVTRGIFVLILN